MRIVITGIGIVSPLALDREGTWDALLAGQRAVGPVTLFSLPGCQANVAAEVDCVDALAPRRGDKPWSRADRMAVTAAREALSQAHLVGGAGVSLVVGGTTAGMFENEELLARVTRDPDCAEPDPRFYSHPLSAPADRIDEILGPFANVRSVCSACSGGATALAWAASQLRSGQSERVLAGGVDALSRFTYAGFAALGALDTELCRPFDRRRAGLNLGEGAAFLLLETEQSALERDAAPIAQLVGWAMASEAHHITHPEPDGATATWTMQRALERAGIRARSVGYVNAHGTATPHNDGMEAQALRRCFEGHASALPVSSIKGHIGHTLAAAGAIEAAVCALAVARGRVPATVGLDEVAPECEGLDYVTEAREMDVRIALSNSFGFGGHDTTLVLARCGEHITPEATAARVVVTGGGFVGQLGLGGTRAALAYHPSGAEADAHSTSLDTSVDEEMLDVEQLPLDPNRARRSSRAARMVTAAIARALDEATLTSEGPHRVATVVGCALGTPGGTGSFLVRVFDRGARFASPAVFPFLLPSALASVPAIYHGLTGPSLSVADLATTGECALQAAAELIRWGEAAAVVAAAAEEHSQVAERIAAPLFGYADPTTKRGEGAAAIVLETAARAAARGAPWRAELSWTGRWRSGDERWRSELPPPRGRARLVLTRPTQMAIPEAWTGVERPPLMHVGRHEGAGAFAFLAAVAAIDEGLADSALVLGSAADRGYAFFLTAPTPPAAPQRSGS